MLPIPTRLRIAWMRQCRGQRGRFRERAYPNKSSEPGSVRKNTISASEKSFDASFTNTLIVANNSDETRTQNACIDGQAGRPVGPGVPEVYLKIGIKLEKGRCGSLGSNTTHCVPA